MRIDNSAIRIAFPYRGGIHFFNPDQIIRIQGASNYIWVHIKDQKPFLIAKVLADYDELLRPHGFIRAHYSHLINSLHVTGIKSPNTIVMDDGTEISMSRRKRKETVNTLLQLAA